MAGEEEQTEKYPMQMVPLLMREENKESNDDYDPKVVSLGPYHHGKEKLKFVEDFKPTAVRMFIETLDENVFMAAILEDIGYTRSCYPEEFKSKYSDEEFARMMLRDACVILNYIGPSLEEESRNRAETIGHLGTAVYISIRRDMYLLENQVPFRILEILVRLKYNTNRHAFIKDMEKFSFKMFFHDEEEKIEEVNETNKLGTKALHLLEIFRRVIVTGHETTAGDNPCCDINNLVATLCCEDADNAPTGGRYVFRSVTDLKSKGIHFRASRIKSLKGVRFSPTQFGHSAKLKLPLLYVGMETRVFFKNVIAYEFSPYVANNDKAVTAYVSFMKLLVVTKQDVKELREKKIIINRLGSDKEVVQVYKDLNTYGAEDNSYFWHVKNEIEEHYNSKAKTWMAELNSTYFNNPWSIVALIGSLFLLCLDIVQTYYTVNGGDPCGSKRPS
ncbi:hypothetical protein K7X08_014434 [Anisodus acutangulus]|uniref:Uncharacterized protein n=1 Tax=Anisodus acutangulus TaxID=402998 RepID=A0A9Q1R184_9SOLA|nr:hypothetical protein K7X08_014434 [Anisodus acutangulus]